MSFVESIQVMLTLIFMSWMVLSVFCLQINKSKVHQLMIRKILFDIELARLKQKMENYFDQDPFLFEDQDINKCKLPYDKIFQEIKNTYYQKYHNTFGYYNKLLSGAEQDQLAGTKKLKQENCYQSQAKYDAAVCNLKNEFYILAAKQQGDACYIKILLKC